MEIDTSTDTNTAADNAVSSTDNTASTPINYSEFIDAQGNFAAPVAGKFKNFEGLVKGYESAQKLLGAQGDKVPVPNENSSEEEWAHFWEKVGRPADPSGYTFEVDEGVKRLEGVYDEEGMKAYAQLAHQVGLTPKQAQAIAGKYFEGMALQHKQFEEQQKATLEAYTEELAKDWGPKDSPRWKKNEQLADVGMDALGITAEDVAAMPEARSPAFLKAMVRVAGMIKERPTAGIGGENGAQGAFGNDIEAQIKAITHDLNGPYHKREHPGHDDAIKQVERLVKLKHAQAA